MMNATMLQRKVMDEIQAIPVERLLELYDVIHFFRIGIERTTPMMPDVMRFAGCWGDLSDDEFDDLLADMAARRATAFSGRNQRETLIS